MPDKPTDPLAAINEMQNTFKQNITESGGPYGEYSVSKVVNIIKNYDWVLRKRDDSTDRKVPAIFLTEYQPKMNQLESTIGAIYKSAVNQTDLLVSLSKLDAFKNGGSMIKQLSATTNADDPQLNVSSFLKPYENMYFTTATNWRYVLPLFKPTQIGSTTTWGDTRQNPGVVAKKMQGLTNFGTDVIQSVVELADLGLNVGEKLNFGVSATEQGIFMERPKFYNFPTSGDSISTSFTLFNTFVHPNEEKRMEQWKRNYFFIKSMICKNLPFKLSLLKYISPVIYSVGVPGVIYMPYAYISKFSATYRGTTRLMDFAEGSGANTRITVPEAWDINITLTSLFNSSANQFLASQTSEIIIN